jgi:ketosteroid isomerase-like protein
MRSDPEGILEAAFQAYAMGDLPTAAAYFAEDAVYAIYIDKDILPFAGEVIGRSAILKVWQDLILPFELAHYAPRIISFDDDIVRCQVEFAFRHRASGEVIDGVLRIVAQVANGQIVRYREYHDQERLRAFMRLVAADVAQMPDF